MGSDGSALAEGFYWHAEKLMWGYEGVAKNHKEAFKLFRQAANLGLSDAHLRIGQLYEYGKGTARDPNAALVSYQTAAEAGNFYAFAFIAKLVSRSSHAGRAEVLWDRFFSALEEDQDPGFLAASPGELLYDYVDTQLCLGLVPRHTATLRRYRREIVAYYQQLLENAISEDRLGRTEAMSKWLKAKLGPWPLRL